MKKFVIVLALLTILFGGYLYFDMKNDDEPSAALPVENSDTVIGYVSKNISQLSPEKEVLGGKFYVTNITVDSGVGTVEYEDGHNAFVAQFSYSFSDDGKVKISGFELIE